MPTTDEYSDMLKQNNKQIDEWTRREEVWNLDGLDGQIESANRVLQLLRKRLTALKNTRGSIKLLVALGFDDEQTEHLYYSTRDDLYALNKRYRGYLKTELELTLTILEKQLKASGGPGMSSVRVRMLKKFVRTRYGLFQELGRAATLEEIARRMDVPIVKVRMYRKVLRDTPYGKYNL